MTDMILDTDIGDDIDDAYALAMAARSAELRLAGVTTVFRSARRRAQLATRLLAELGRAEVPVRAGCDMPLVETPRGRNDDRHDVKGAFIPSQHAGDYEEVPVTGEHAVDFIIAAVRGAAAPGAPGRVSLVGIGPLTTIAMALRKAPDMAGALQSITLMGGVYSEQFPEWNILCDPEAAWVVFHAGAPLRLVGLDVTMQCLLSEENVRRMSQRRTGALSLLDLWTRRWFSHSGSSTPVLHDPLAVATLVDPTLVTWEERTVEVVLEGRLRGCTTTRRPVDRHGVTVPGPRAQVAVAVDVRRFTELFMERILSA